MTWAMTIGSNADLNLNDLTNYRLLEYNPTVNGVEDRTGDTIKIELLGTTTAAIGAAYNALQKILWQAKYYSDIDGDDLNRIYLRYTPDGYASYRETQVYNGVIELSEDSQDWAWWTYNKRVVATITIERDNFWEGAAAAVETMANDNGTGLTAPDIYACNDKVGAAGSKRVNFAHFVFSPTGADLPSPVKINLNVNDGGGASPIRNIMIGMLLSKNYYASTDAILFLDQSGTADANCSGGQYKACAWSGTAATAIITQAISQFLALKRNYFRVVARLRDVTGYADLYAQARIVSAGGTVLGQSAYQKVSSARLIVDFGAIKLTPRGYDIGSSTANLVIYVKRATAGSHAINVDYLQLFPLDGYRRFGEDISLAGNDTLSDNQIDGEKVTRQSVAATSEYISGIVSFGSPILLVPGFDHYFCFVWDQVNIASPITRYMGLTINYKPRTRAI